MSTSLSFLELSSLFRFPPDDAGSLALRDRFNGGGAGRGGHNQREIVSVMVVMFSAGAG